MALRVVAMAFVMAAGVLPHPAEAQAVRVVADGQVVAFDQPPVVVAGRVLIPLRGVFERLGAQVEWQPDPGRVVARHGATVVVLQPGVRRALVDGRTVLLDVPPMVLAGRTLVPLRFVGEALGASVNWDPAGRIVHVTSARYPAPPPAAAPLPGPPEPVRPLPVIPPAPPEPVRPTPVVPPTPQLVSVEGTVAQVDPYALPARLHVAADGMIWRFAVTAATTIFLTEVSSGRSGSVSLDQIRRGDSVRVTADALGQALSVRAYYRALTGLVESIGSRVMALGDGQILRIAGEAAFFLDGRQVTWDLLRRGMEVELRANPQTGDVWEIRARTPTPPLPIPPVPMPRPIPTPIYPLPPRIYGAYISDHGPLGIGATLVVTLRGTPRGSAWFDIGRIERGVGMVEGPLGTYTGRYAVRHGDTASRAGVTVRLRVAGMEIEMHAGTVVIDGLPPEFTRRSPEPGSVVSERQPTIILGLAERGPAGLDPGSFRLWVNGREARPVAITETSALYSPADPLPQGPNRVQARVADLARNEATTSWTFTIEPTRPPTPTLRPTPPPRPEPTPVPTPTPWSRPTPGPAPTPTPPVIAPPGPSPPVRPEPPAQPAPPVIVAPRPGDAIDSPLLVRGTAAGAAQVKVTVEYARGRADGHAVLIGPINVPTSGQGAWEARVQLAPRPRAGDRLTITAVAVGAGGVESRPARVVITVGE